MRYTMMAFLFCLISPIVNAQEIEGPILDLQKPLRCAKAEAVMQHFATVYEEKPIWVGKTVADTHITVLVNKQNRSFTIIEYNSGLACVLGSGSTSSNPDI